MARGGGGGSGSSGGGSSVVVVVVLLLAAFALIFVTFPRLPRRRPSALSLFPLPTRPPLLPSRHVYLNVRNFQLPPPRRVVKLSR